MKERLPRQTHKHGQAGISRTLLLSVLVALVLTGLGAWWWAHRSSSAGNADSASPGVATGASAPASAAGGSGRRFGGSNRVQPVSVTAAKRQDIRVILSAIGNISALNTATVRTHVDGELKAIRFKEGQSVRAGAVLVEIDPRNYEIGLAQAQGQLARDVAQLRNAQLDLVRYKDLLAKDSIAKQQVETQDALVRQLAGTVQTDQAQVDSARLQLSYTKVTAPISGRLGLKQVDLGNVVHAADATGLVSITQTQPIAVVFAVPEANLRQISSQLKAGQALVVEAWDREQKVKLAVGQVSSTDNAIDIATGTLKLKAEFPNKDNELFPNQFVNVRLQVDALNDALVVPTSATQRGAQGTYVYVVKDDGTVSMRRVRLGATEGDWTSVQGELAAGERVVTDGADRLRDGAKVEVIAAPARAAGAGPANATAPLESKPARKGASAPADTAAPEAGERPRWMDRLPPDQVEKVKAMSPEERRAYFQQMRERRQQTGQ
ncbi:MAG: MdtA/MuxA family multidrug efflux RND transporter periplasmic adaptor subunit [Pseudomonadota bacterium]